jgi:DNA-binding MarR family transcriptional regulator
MVAQVSDPREQVSYLLWQLAHTMQQEMTMSLAELNLTLSQLGALAHLARDDSLSTAHLARLSGVTPQNMSLTVAKLEAEGYITRQPHPTHGRMNRLEPTTRGRTVLQQGMIRVKRVENETFADFSPYERTELPELLRRAIRRIRHGPAGRTRELRAI